MRTAINFHFPVFESLMASVYFFHAIPLVKLNLLKLGTEDFFFLEEIGINLTILFL
jgi:hypothetical protein